MPEMDCVGRDRRDDDRRACAGQSPSPTPPSVDDHIGILEARLMLKLLPQVKAKAHEETITLTNDIAFQIRHLESRVDALQRQQQAIPFPVKEPFKPETTPMDDAKQRDELVAICKNACVVALRGEVDAMRHDIASLRQSSDSNGVKDVQVSTQDVLSREELNKSLDTLRLENDHTLGQLQSRLEEAREMTRMVRVRKALHGNGCTHVDQGNGTNVPAFQTHAMYREPLPGEERNIDLDEYTEVLSWFQRVGRSQLLDVIAQTSEMQGRLENLELRLQKDMLSLTQSLEISGPLLTELKTQIKNEALADVQKRANGREKIDLSAVLPEAVTIEASSADDTTKNISFEYCLQESIWDLGIFVGTSIMGMYGSLMVALLVLLNIIMQIGFCVVCHYNFTDNPFDEATQNGLRDFRLRIAHDQWFVDTTTLQSLVSQICAHGVDDAFKRNALVYGIAQVDTLAAINTYLLDLDGSSAFEKMFNGTTLCILALACWILTVFKHFNAIWHFCYALLGLPRGSLTDISLNGEDLALKSISRVRAVLIVLVIIIRFACASTLLYYGGYWLSYTTDPKDLVLNAAALEFILDLDQMLFAALAPVASKNFLQGMQPISEKAWRIHKGIDALSVLGLLTFASLTACFYAFFVRPLVTSMDDAKRILCHGDLNLIFSRDTVLGMLWFGDNAFYRASDWGTGEVDYMMEAIDKKIYWEVPKIGEQASKYGLDVLTLQDMGIGELIHRLNRDCTDTPSSKATFQYLRTFWRNNDGPDMQSCADFRDQCMRPADVLDSEWLNGFRMLRLMCPETCGCVSPVSIIPDHSPSYGCPTSCTINARYQEVLSNLSCSDTNFNELSVSPSWVLWIEYLTLKIDANHGALSEYIAGMKQFGCEFLKNVSKSSRRQICEGTFPIFELRPLSPICPEICDCASGIIEKCAPQCTPLYSGVAR